MEDLSDNNIVIVACIAIFALFFVQNIQVKTYEEHTIQTINKVQYLLDSRVAILKPAEKFYQAAMQERLPVALRRPQVVDPFVNITISSSFI